MNTADLLAEAIGIMRAAIAAGDWKVDGACDPDSILRRADLFIASESANRELVEQVFVYGDHGPEWRDAAEDYYAAPEATP